MTDFILSRRDVDPTRESRYTVWPLHSSSQLGASIPAVSGVVAYRPQTTPPPNGEPHDFAEFYYVLDGTGKARLGDVELELTAGDALVVPAGTPHMIWSTADAADVLAFYVALVEE